MSSIDEILENLGLPPVQDCPHDAPTTERFVGWTIEQLDTFIDYCEKHEDELPLTR